MHRRPKREFFLSPPRSSAWITAMTACALVASGECAARAASFEEDVQPFLAKYCYRCHGAKTQKADRRFDALSDDLAAIETAQQWQDIVDQLNLGTMPPEGARQPEPDELRSIVAWISDELATAHQKRESTGGHAVLRRLNRSQYDRTVRDLLALPDLLTGPTEKFPPDEVLGQFDNIGSALVMSDFLLEAYVEAADMLVRRATSGGAKPPARTYRFTAPFSPTVERPDSQDAPGQYQHIRKNTSDRGGHLWIEALTAGVPHDGYYRLRFKAQGISRDHPYDDSIVGTRRSEPLRAQIVVGSSAYGYLESRTASDRPRDEFELAEDQPRWYETTLWLDAGYQPRITFPNGPRSVRSIRKKLIDAHAALFPKFSQFVAADAASEKAWAEYKALLAAGYKPAPPPAPADGKRRRLSTAGTSRTQNTSAGWATFYREYQGPRVRVFEIELEGPLYDEWPAPSHRALYGDYAPTVENTAPILRRFATRAFRRPVDEAELATLVELASARRQRGDSPHQAIEAALKAILCSPSFLYLVENDGPLDDYALASRLSYFIWSSMPDDELLACAHRGELHDQAVLEAQARRLLADRRSTAFVEEFTSRWLTLYKLGSMPPDAVRFRDYYNDGLEEAMRTETQMFFRCLLDENLPIDRFLDSDFSFINSSLARLYGIDGVTGTAFRKVALGDSRRGGLLGQASVLTVTANGIDTSPVTRGVWLLENVLGAGPSPPPPDVEPLEPDIRGATTIRDQLLKHREITTCAECHRKIDPLGFALENFDPIGAWRDRYGRGASDGPRVDASGRLYDGSEFSNVVGLKQILMDRRGQFARCLTEKVMSYALGRTVEPGDRAEIDRMVDSLDRSRGGLRDLVLLVVASDPFRSN